jgi:hypothetical protein
MCGAAEALLSRSFHMSAMDRVFPGAPALRRPRLVVVAVEEAALSVMLLLLPMFSP